MDGFSTDGAFRIGMIAYHDVALQSRPEAADSSTLKALKQGTRVTEANSSPAVNGMVHVRTDAGDVGWVRSIEVRWDETVGESPAGLTRQYKPTVEIPTHEGLTPSDLILLDAAIWRQDEISATKFLSANPPTSAFRSAIAVAFLANESAGNVRLDLIEQRYVRFIKVTHINAYRTGQNLRWPPDSLEASLNRPGHVDQVIYDWVGRDYHRPEHHMLDEHIKSLAAREVVLQRPSGRTYLGLFTFSPMRYELPASTARMMTRLAVGEANRLLGANARKRPEVHKRLLSAIGHAFTRRTQPD